ncbi:N,N-dimethylformamidase beta subunit family domain-containing protein [Vibrio nigripulchritudo]|uniref:N,N-dimethylformamidase beta subunit family domain-containing protein n=1 Tax=Vibrio nigripulchritudo TaxID=28173 RepID=UPI0005FA0693|nr:N,N-dimethylformamidase beta subunit family domain-containing protein [Vibrio nigripulchritudo]KJY78552.1 hypothetical protein TW74_10785 [Vibrio nigripulchritudo]
MLNILAYPSAYSASPGESIEFKISSEDGSDVTAQLVEVRHGDCNPEGPGVQFKPVSSDIDGIYQVKKQAIDAGSYGVTEPIPHLMSDDTVTISAMIWPTLISRDEQTILCQRDEQGNGFHLMFTGSGRLTLVLYSSSEKQAFQLPASMLERQWYAISCEINLAQRKAVLSQTPLIDYATIRDASTEVFELDSLQASYDNSPLWLAGAPSHGNRVDFHMDGKVDSLTIYSKSVSSDDFLQNIKADQHSNEAKYSWDFSQSIDTVEGKELLANSVHFRFHHLPTRGMKGWNWDGSFHSFLSGPQHYGAVHFHHDDIYDANWDTTFTFVVPDTLPSGAYAIHIENGETTPEITCEDYVPFFVTPHKDKSKRRASRLAFLAPTCSYIAYANHGEHITAREAERSIGRLLEFGHHDIYMYQHPELGGSLYDSHRDGSGVCYSSRLRPVLNFSARYRSWLGGHGSALWQYNADTHLFGWLHHHNFEFDVITDEDLHEQGADYLEQYDVIMTGTHPEYYSTEMWDGLKTWIDDGGRLMYLGANGFYWRIAFHSQLPGAIEVRRAEDGIRTWAAEPGEYYNSFSGEFGGLWRRIGRTPNLMCGLGFMAQGFDICSYYRRGPDSYNPRVAFIFEGIEDEKIGDFGLIGGGAAGLELDAIDVSLGSPVNILRLASSEEHSRNVRLVNEEFGVVPPNLGGDENEKVRADLAFYETPSGGAVFSTGSISWCGSLAWNHYENNVSKLTYNVLSRFLNPEPFET